MLIFSNHQEQTSTRCVGLSLEHIQGAQPPNLDELIVVRLTPMDYLPYNTLCMPLDPSCGSFIRFPRCYQHKSEKNAFTKTLI